MEAFEMGKDSMPQLVKGLTLFCRLKPAHNELHQQYKALVEARSELMVQKSSCLQHDSNLNAHACLSRDYAKTLLTLCKPARGRLASLLSEQCAAGLMYSLLYDLCLHLNRYVVEESPDSEKDSPGRSHPCKNDPLPEVWFSRRAGGAIQMVLEQLARGEHAETEVDYNDQGLFMPDLLRNYHNDFENFLNEEDTKFVNLKNSKVREVVANDGKALHRRQVLPTVGVLALWSEPVEDAPVELGVLQTGYSMMSSFFGSSRGETALPSTLEEYMNQFGVYIIVALDKLETKLKLPKVIRDSCLKILLQTFLFVAKTSDSDKLSGDSRKSNYLSPRFSICMEDILTLFDNGFDRIKFSACSYYRELNNYSAFDEWARNIGDLDQSSKSEICYTNSSLAGTGDPHVQYGFLEHLTNYLDSLLMKSLMFEVEASLDNKQLTCTAVRYCSLNLADSVDSLMDERFKNVFELRGCGHRLAYCCAVKFLMFSLSPFFFHHRSAHEHNGFFPLMLEQMEKLPKSLDFPDQGEAAPDSVHGRRIVSHAVADAICDSFLSVLVFGTKPRTSSFGKYMKVFFSERLPLGLEHVIPFLSSASVASVVKKFGKLIENVKSERLFKKRPQEIEVMTRDHHVGSLRSPLYMSYVDPRVCSVATFVKFLLAVYRSVSDDLAEKCLDTLQEVGLCCCFDCEFILQDMIPSMFDKSPEVVSKSLNFLESVFMGTLDGARLAPVDYCLECSLSIASVEVKDSENKLSEALVLSGSLCGLQSSRFIPYDQVSSAANRWFLKSNGRVVCYRSLKWAGMKAYAAFRNRFDPTCQEHISRLARFGRKEIQSIILDSVYEPMLQSLNEMKVFSEIIRDPTKISALQFIFSGLSVLLLTNCELSLKMTDSFWIMWTKLVQHGQKDMNGSLLGACYEFSCAATLSHMTIKSASVVPYPKKINPHSECLKVLESSILDVQTRWTGLLSQSTEKTEELVAQSYSVAVVWSCLAEFCCLPQFVRFIELRFFDMSSSGSSTLDPLRILKTLFKCLASKDSWPRDALLSCPDSTFDLVRSLLKVIAICPAWEGSRPAALSEVKAALGLHLLTRHIKPLMFGALDVNCSATANQKGGQLWATSGDPQTRCRDQAGTIAAYFSALEHSNCQVQLWPQLLEEVLSALMQRTSLIVEQLQRAKVKAKTGSKSKATEESILSTAVTSTWSTLSYMTGAATSSSTAAASAEEEVAAFSDSDDEADVNYHDKEQESDELVCELLVLEEPPMSKDRLEEVVQLLEECLSKVLEVVEDAPPYVELYLQNVKIMDKLLQGFDQVLRNSHKFKGVAGLVLRLWARFARAGITTEQLGNFFRIFMGRKPPVREMLSVLESLLLQSMKSPLSCVKFTNDSVCPDLSRRPQIPQHLAGYDLGHNGLKSGSVLPLHGFVTKSKNLSRYVKNFCNYRAEIIHENVAWSGVSQARIACVLPCDNSSESWAPFICDTTLAFWCKLDRDSRLTGPIDLDQWTASDFECDLKSGLHIFTVGVKKLMLSAFLCARTGYCRLQFFRAASATDLCSKLSTCDLDFRKFLDGDWHFVTLSLAGINTKKAADIEFNYSVDAQFASAEVTLAPLGSINPEAPFVLLGHRGLVYTDETGAPRQDTVASNIDDALSMTNFTMWRLPKLDVLTGLLLMSFGKDLENFLASQREASADLLKNFMTVEVMEYLKLNCTRTQVPDFLCGKLENSVLDLNKSLLFHFNSHRPGEFVVYDHIDRGVQDVCGRYSVACVRYSLHFEGLLLPVRQRGALQALLHLGGTHALLYLLARVVELNTVDYTAVPRATKSNGPNSGHFTEFENRISENMMMLEESDEFSQLIHHSGKTILVRREEANEDGPVWSAATGNPGGGACQAACLQLLYSCFRHSPDLCRQFHACNGNEMIMRLLCSPKMDTRLEVFKVLLDQCFSESMITLEQTSVLFSVVEEAPVQGRFVPPSCRVLVTDAGLLASLLEHWPRVELRKKEMRDSAYDTLVVNMNTEGMEESSAEMIKAKYRESLNLPERLVSDWTFGPCHLVDVLLRVVVAVLSRSNSSVFDTLNFQLLHRTPILESCLYIAQELHVRDWAALQANPRLLRDLLSVFLPEKKKELPYWNTVLSSLLAAFTEVLELLVLGIDPHVALRWHANSCTARLNKFLCRKKLNIRAALYESRLRNLVDTELADEVTEDVARLIPVLDATVAAEECLGVLTSEDEKLLSSGNAEQDPLNPRQVLRKGYLHEDDMSTQASFYLTNPLLEPKLIVEKRVPTTVSGPVLSDGVPLEHGVPCDQPKELAARDCGEDRGESLATSPLDVPIEMVPFERVEGHKSETSGSKLADSAPSSPTTSDSTSLVTGRTSTPPVQPARVAKEMIPELSQSMHHLISGLYEFFRLLDGNGFEQIVLNTLKPHHLSILANHENVGVRCMVVKILKDVLCRCSARTRTPFKEHLVIVHHQLACHKSSTELLEECFLLVVSIPALGSDLSTPLDLITAKDDANSESSTSKMNYHLSSFEVHERILSYSLPLLAVLPKVYEVDVKSVLKVLDLLSAVVDHCTRSGGCDRLLAMPGLGESLLLTLDSSLQYTAFDAAPIVTLYTDLVRSLLLLGDDFASRGFDLVTKFFVFCEHQRSDFKRYSACLKALSKMLVNCFKSLLRAMLVASSFTLETELKPAKLSPAYIKQILKEEAKKREPFIPADRSSAYYADFLEDSPLAERTGVALGTRNYVERTIRLLKMAENFVAVLDWTIIVSSNAPLSGVSWSLPLFLLDLHTSILRSWDPLPTPAGRVGFVGKVKLPRHQLELLSLEHQSEARRFLPELVCVLLHPRTDRLSRRGLIARLATHYRLILLCCKSADDKIYKTVCYFLWMARSVYSNSRLSGVFSNFASTLDLFSFESNYNEFVSLENAHFEPMITKRSDRANRAIEFDVETCLSKSIAEHEAHEKVISDLFNKFLVMHSKVKRKVFERINVGEENLSLQTVNWLELCASCSGPHSPWKGHTSMWWELVENTNKDLTRSLVVQKSFNVGKQFFTEQSSKHPLKRQKPLESVLGGDHEIQAMIKGSVLGSSLESSVGEIEVVYTGKGWVIKPGIEFWGTIFVVADVGISFKGKKTVFGWSKACEKSMDSVFHIYFNKMASVRKMSYRLNETAFEVHLRDRTSWFFVCGSQQERDDVVRLLLAGAGLSAEMPVLEAVAKATAEWQARKMSNFDYLMLLNSLAGRNYNDLNQYPVFPYVLADYTSKVLDLDDPNSYRDLSKPMPVQTKDREEFFTKKYHERVESDLQGIGIPFHYTSLFSNSIVVKTYLVRLPPFTVYFLHFQGGRFDHPSRTYHSVEKAYDLISRDTFTDFKEAIPEMYYLPEMFANREEFNMRGTEKNCDIDKVILPPWSEGDPLKFVVYHRAALESNYVTENLPHWIDLVFGFKQCGKKCVEALNKYHPSGYREHLGNENMAPELWTSMTGLYGELPPQLFKNAAHPKPQREAMKEVMNMEFLETVLPSTTLKGMRWGCFAFFSATARSDLLTAPSSGPTSRVGLNYSLVMTGDADRAFLAAPLDTHLLVDDTAKIDVKIHLLQAFFGDGVLRVWSPGFTVSYPLATLPSYTKVTCCSADAGQVWLGTDCGQVLLYYVEFVKDIALGLNTMVCSSAHVLQGHSAAVTALCVCQHFNVCVTGDTTGHCCVWDMHTPALVRRVPCFSNRVTHVLVSKTSGNWLCATDGGSSYNLLLTPPVSGTFGLKLYTLNGEQSAETTLPEPVRCLAMTSLREGRAVNVIAVVMRSHLALFSSWDLQQLRTTKFARENPVDLLRWSDDSQHLAVQWRTGEYMVYPSASAVAKKEPLMKMTNVELPTLLRQP